jgi:acetyl esterase/lipase
VNPHELLNPDIAAIVNAAPIPDMNAETVAMIRSVGFTARTEVVLSDAVERTDRIVSEDPRVTVRVHRPAGFSGPLPCWYSIHGGGYLFGSNDMDDVKFDELCPKLGLIGVSVDYRLAPETAYPGPLEDCYAGLAWTHEHAEELGIDRGRIGIGGVSAGGGLAAALALLTRDRGELPVAFQLLDCPMLDDRQHTISSQWDGLAVWSRHSNAFGWQSYLGDLYGTADIPYTAAPARASDEDLVGLPPAYVSVGSVDGFMDEDVEYALRLNHVGVPCDLHVYSGACHGYSMAVDSTVAEQSRRDVADWLARQISA